MLISTVPTKHLQLYRGARGRSTGQNKALSWGLPTPAPQGRSDHCFCRLLRLSSYSDLPHCPPTSPRCPSCLEVSTEDDSLLTPHGGHGGDMSGMKDEGWRLSGSGTEALLSAPLSLPPAFLIHTYLCILVKGTTPLHHQKHSLAIKPHQLTV